MKQDPPSRRAHFREVMKWVSSVARHYYRPHPGLWQTPIMAGTGTRKAPHSGTGGESERGKLTSEKIRQMINNSQSLATTL